MTDHASEDAEGEREYYVVPAEALELLPAEWRNQLQEILEDGRTVLASVDREMSVLIRLSNSLATLTTLKHIKRRLAEHAFAPNLDAILDLDMLTTAFVVSYFRLSEGGIGSGFNRRGLPANLRESHDRILELRNKRFAHHADHYALANAMEVAIRADAFQVNLSFNMIFQVGGANEWHALVDHLDGMYAGRLASILAKLKDKTGREWILPPPPAG